VTTTPRPPHQELHTPDVHTIIGAGQIGLPLARLLADAGYRVRLVRRSAPGPEIPGVTWLQGDITDPAFATRACQGATVVYNCANPPDYHRWDGVIQPLFGAIQAAATAAGARLVVLDNLYAYGPTGGVPLTEQTPERPTSVKGKLRKALTDELRAAHARGELSVSIGRASDYFGPRTPASVYGDRLLDALQAGRAVELFGPPELPRAWSYTHDVATGLAVLGTHPESAGRVWHLPVAASGSTQELLDAFAAELGVPLKTRRVPRWALRGVGMFVPALGAMVEMLYQWEEPFVVDDSAFCEAFGVSPTPLHQAVAETVAAWRSRSSARATAPDSAPAPQHTR